MASKRKHKWSIDFAGRSKGDRHLQTMANLVAPVGYVETSSAVEQANSQPEEDLITKRSWEVALGPVKQLPMNMFIMWMAGGTISIFPIMMVGMMFFRPIQALIAIQNTFKMIEGGQAPLQKLVYLLGNVACLGLAVYKCQGMGLLPTHASDWLAFVDPLQRMEWTGGGVLL